MSKVFEKALGKVFSEDLCEYLHPMQGHHDPRKHYNDAKGLQHRKRPAS